MNFPTQSKVQLGKILLAEDDNDMRRFLGKALQNAGYGVVSFDNGLSAYNRLCEEPFELLLTDIVMPEMDGIELARRAGSPKAFRAVGQANALNPIPIIIPCHRVIAADGGLGGFSSGLARKRWLLEHEGAGPRAQTPGPKGQ